MTYREIRDKLNAIPADAERLDDDASVACLSATEVFPVIDFINQPWAGYPGRENEALGLDFVTGIIDDDHMFFTIDH